MRGPTDRLNRALLVLLGVITALLGIAGLARGGGAIGGDGTDPIISAELRSQARDRQVLLLAVLALAGMAVLWLGFSWLLAQLPKDRPVGHVALERTEHATSVEVSATAITDALAADVGQLDGVTHARAKVIRQHPLTIELDVSLEDGTDLNTTGRAIAERPKRRLLQALDLPDVELRARFKLARPAARKVA